MTRRSVSPALLWVVAGCYLSSPVSDRDRVRGPDGDGFAPDDVPGRDADATATEGGDSADATADGDDAREDTAGDGAPDGAGCVPYDPARLCGPWDCSCSPPTERPCPAGCVDVVSGDCIRGLGVFNTRIVRLMPDEMDLPDFPGWTFRHDGTEILVLIEWFDCMEAAGCSDHCASTGDRGYVIDAASGAVLYSMRAPWASLLMGPRPPSPCRPTDPAGGCTSECPGGEPPCVPFDRFPDEWMIPEGCEPNWGLRASQNCCEVLVPDFDMRYSDIHPCLHTADYRGARDGYWYGAIGRNRISTGEWLPSIDLPLVEDVVVF